MLMLSIMNLDSSVFLLSFVNTYIICAYNKYNCLYYNINFSLRIQMWKEIKFHSPIYFQNYPYLILRHKYWFSDQNFLWFIIKYYHQRHFFTVETGLLCRTHLALYPLFSSLNFSDDGFAGMLQFGSTYLSFVHI